jgi:hypothetical protein
MKGKNPEIVLNYQQKKRPTQIELGVFTSHFLLLSSHAFHDLLHPLFNISSVT